MNDEEKKPKTINLDTLSKAVLCDLFDHSVGLVTNTTFESHPDHGALVTISVALNGCRLTFKVPIADYILTFASIYKAEDGMMELTAR